MYPAAMRVMNRENFMLTLKFEIEVVAFEVSFLCWMS